MDTLSQPQSILSCFNCGHPLTLSGPSPDVGYCCDHHSWRANDVLSPNPRRQQPAAEPTADAIAAFFESIQKDECAFFYCSPRESPLYLNQFDTDTALALKRTSENQRRRECFARFLKEYRAEMFMACENGCEGYCHVKGGVPAGCNNGAARVVSDADEKALYAERQNLPYINDSREYYGSGVAAPTALQHGGFIGGNRTRFNVASLSRSVRCKLFKQIDDTLRTRVPTLGKAKPPSYASGASAHKRPPIDADWMDGGSNTCSMKPTLYRAADGARLSSLPQLLAMSDWAFCGKGEATVMDHSARKTQKIGRDVIEVQWGRNIKEKEEDAANHTANANAVDLTPYDEGLEQAVRSFQSQMCPHWVLGAALHEVLVYSEGDHFRAHRDARKFPSHVATMVVGVDILCENDEDTQSAFIGCEGGDLVLVEHGLLSQYEEKEKEKKKRDNEVHKAFEEGDDHDEYDAVTRDSFVGKRIIKSNTLGRWSYQGGGVGGGTWCAWFIETEHAVEPITSGHRVVAVYNLFVVGGAPSAIAALTDRSQDDGDRLPESDAAPSPSPSSSLLARIPADVWHSLIFPCMAFEDAKAFNLVCKRTRALLCDGVTLVLRGGGSQSYTPYEASPSSFIHSGSCAKDLLMAARFADFDSSREENLLAIADDWLTRAAWGNYNALGFAAVHTYALNGKAMIVGTAEVLRILRGKDRHRAIGVAMAIERRALGLASEGMLKCDASDALRRRRVVSVRTELCLVPALAVLERSWDVSVCCVGTHFSDRSHFMFGPTGASRYVESEPAGKDDEDEGDADEEGEEDEDAKEFEGLPPREDWESVRFDTECDDYDVVMYSRGLLKNCLMLDNTSDEDLLRVAREDAVTQTEGLWGNQNVFKAFAYKKIAVVIRLIPQFEN